MNFLLINNKDDNQSFQLKVNNVYLINLTKEYILSIIDNFDFMTEDITDSLDDIDRLEFIYENDIINGHIFYKKFKIPLSSKINLNEILKKNIK